MKITSLLLLILFATTDKMFADDMKLWYKSPAKDWNEGLPVGNGRLMGVVLGGIQKERVQINEETIWTGQPTERDRKGASNYLDEVRQLMFEGKYYEAELLTEEKMMGMRLDFGIHTYQELGNLDINFKYQSKSPKITEYKRELDMDKAIVKVSYKVDGVTYTRETFSSPVDQAIIVRITCDKPNGLNLTAGISRRSRNLNRVISDNRISLRGSTVGKSATGWRGVTYEAQLHADSEDAKISASEDIISVKNGTSVTLRLVGASNYRGEDPAELCKQYLDLSDNKSYQNMRKEHIAEHQRLFRRVSMDLGKTDISELPTDLRLEALRRGYNDPHLIAQYFQFGRYLLISSSRPGSMAVNLWGKWMLGLYPLWNGNYHININTQMNYWPAEICNLAECHEPFFDLLDSLRTRGRVTAKEVYNCRGFVAHHATDAWYYTAPIGNPPYGMWPMAPAWCAQHLWEHYLFGEDKEYLEKRSYPIMKEAAEFLVDYLVEDPNTGYLATGPSTSPENRFITDNEKVVSLSMSPSMDIQLTRDLFNNCIEASKVLNKDKKFRKKLEELSDRLPPMRIGEDGRILEWEKPFKEHDPGHRHISHLWGLSPGSQITEKTPDLFEAARKSLDVRVEHGAAESHVYQGIRAWVVSCYTRLFDGDKAYEQIHDILTENSWPNLFAVSEKGRERKMFETDVNFGNCAAIAEMILQSHDECINILPALPGELQQGSVKGLRARGAFEIDVEWEKGELKVIKIKSLKGNACKVRYKGKEIEFDTAENAVYKLDSNLKRI